MWQEIYSIDQKIMFLDNVCHRNRNDKNDVILTAFKTKKSKLQQNLEFGFLKYWNFFKFNLLSASKKS